MTREEEIQKLIDEENGIDNYGSADYQVGVCDGVRLADANPKSSWISVDEDLPNDETKLYIIYCEAYNKNGDNIENKHYEIYLANFDKEMSSWINVESYNNYFFNVLYWMPIPELPK